MGFASTIRKCIVLCGVTAALALLSTMAEANGYELGAGSRSVPLAGWDIANQEQYSSGELLGEWTAVHFWASWCGPCMRELPEFVRAVQAKNPMSGLRVVSVSLDSDASLASLRRTVELHGISFPVLYSSSEFDSPICLDWGISAIPAGRLVNPQGVVVSGYESAEEFHALLDYCMLNTYPIIFAEAAVSDFQGEGLYLDAHVGSSDHTPLQIQINVAWDRWELDSTGDGTTIVGSESNFIRSFTCATVAFEEFGETTQRFEIRPDPMWDRVQFHVLVSPADKNGVIPDCFRATYSTPILYLSEIGETDGKWKLLKRWSNEEQ